MRTIVATSGMDDAAIAAAKIVSMDLRTEWALHIDSLGVPALNWSERRGYVSNLSHNFGRQTVLCWREGLSDSNLNRVGPSFVIFT